MEKIWLGEFDIEPAKSPSVNQSWKNVLKEGILVPDEVVFLGENPFQFNFVSENTPEILSVFASAKYSESEWIADFVDVLTMIAKNVKNSDNIRYLTDGEIDQLLNWDAEKFRQSNI